MMQSRQIYGVFISLLVGVLVKEANWRDNSSKCVGARLSMAKNITTFLASCRNRCRFARAYSLHGEVRKVDPGT